MWKMNINFLISVYLITAIILFVLLFVFGVTTLYYSDGADGNIALVDDDEVKICGKIKEWLEKEEAEKEEVSWYALQAEKIKLWFALKEEQLRSWFSAEEEPTEGEESDNWKYSMIALGIFLFLGLVFLLIYFIRREHPTHLKLKDGKWIYDPVYELEEPEDDDIGCLEKTRLWIVGVYDKISKKVRSWFGKDSAENEITEARGDRGKGDNSLKPSRPISNEKTKQVDDVTEKKTGKITEKQPSKPISKEKTEQVDDEKKTGKIIEKYIVV